ncbi:hypothetical protein roselon_02130 [Roseibacterium elongatum DSM 19469]|uniref:Uncharacterized protein n=1 Tax=Roseicyclus elongatus DSM 19469 TaxID=1294273 RepID=W8SPP3_9RHOB|nr:hypothetical protein [Roseibacterium elongatum]AHM04475.1 hypothetical protein roselon_02130 [Roseibacterium elongatum DSM 19469]
MLSFRQGLGGSLYDGFVLRFDAAHSAYDAGASDGTLTNLRLLAGYAMPLDSTARLTFFGGVSYRDRSYSPNSPFLDEVDEAGVFVSVEFNYDQPNGNEGFALAEYDSVEETFYTSAFYLFGLNYDIRVGPTVNYLDEGDYSRTAAGLRAAFDIGDSAEISVTGAWAEGDTGGNTIDSSYAELQFRITF